MATYKEYINKIESGAYDERLVDVYADPSLLAYQKTRYVDAIRHFVELFGVEEVAVYSAPGRSEVSGNHTDHQRGHVLAASINLDAVGIVSKTEDNIVHLVSGDAEPIHIALDHVNVIEEEKGTTAALIRGVAAGLHSAGYAIGGANIYVVSDVLMGSGMSSSAAFECLMGTIMSGLYNEMKVPPVEIAKIGQYAENVYFGKPCGLMDQMACSVGGLIHVNFERPEDPETEKLEFDLNAYDYSLCITDTKGSHANLTDEYAAIPEEMRSIAEYFKKDVLLEICVEDIYNNMGELRKLAGDRAVLRALHFIGENERVQNEVEAIKAGNIARLFELIKESGNSSYKFLQNIYSNKDVRSQNVSLALAVSELVLGNHGVCRVHGGGFAGTIQAFVENAAVYDYQKRMDGMFGENACRVLKIRKYGGIKVL
ncbi:MAG: galactokinase [Lachnospiraceae bacterium]|nr:galactokinase [Lachnospiraceae bacterium]